MIDQKSDHRKLGTDSILSEVAGSERDQSSWITCSSALNLNHYFLNNDIHQKNSMKNKNLNSNIEVEFTVSLLLGNEHNLSNQSNVCSASLLQSDTLEDIR